MSTIILALFALANVCYGEARGESEQGKLAVMHVVLNRSKADKWYWGGDSIPGVAQYPYQFAGYRVGLHATPSEKQDCLRLAEEVLEGETEDPTDGSVMFANWPTPPWASRYEMTKKIGNHYFWKTRN